MASTDENNKLRTLAAAISIGGLAIFGATACDDGGDDADTGDDAVEEPADEGADDPAAEDPADDADAE